MNYKYNHLTINLEENEVFYLWDLISFALDYDAQNNCLTDEKRAFAKKLLNITDEMK